jgi:hypothetical protein
MRELCLADAVGKESEVTDALETLGQCEPQAGNARFMPVVQVKVTCSSVTPTRL